MLCTYLLRNVFKEGTMYQQQRILYATVKYLPDAIITVDTKGGFVKWRTLQFMKLLLTQTVNDLIFILVLNGGCTVYNPVHLIVNINIVS